MASRHLLGIKWQDKITNNEVLQRAKMDGIEGDANEGTVEMGLSRAANERQSHAEIFVLFGAVLRRQK